MQFDSTGRADSPLGTAIRAHFAAIGLSAVALCISACSGNPAQEDAQRFTAEETSRFQPSLAPAVNPELDAAINAALAAPIVEEEPQTTEEAVANAVAEQNLINRIRAGFAMPDADHANVDREIAWFARHPDYLDRTFRRAERYLFFIVEELEARNMPLELALLPIVESAFNPVALSHARASGLWQFIPSTGRRYGLEQNHQYDGRRDIVESTRAALDYLQFLADEFDGNWHHAVAAYNCGEMNVARAIARNRAAGRPTDFFSLSLPRETRGYVPKLLAIRRIVEQPQKFGLEFGLIANQPYFVKVELEAPIDLGVAAHLADLPKEDLIALNPAYHRAVTSPDGPGFLLVPVDRAERLRQGLAELSPDQRVPKLYYTVHRGDTVSSVAKKLGVTQAELRANNRIKKDLLQVGQELVINRGAVTLKHKAPEPLAGVRIVSTAPDYIPPPVPPRATYNVNPGDSHRVRRGETLWSVARTYGVSLELLARENNLGSKSLLSVGQKLRIPAIGAGGAATLAATDARAATLQRITYQVRSGDTVTRIAQSFRVTVADLMSWNNLRNANNIKAGQKLVMYVGGSRNGG